MANIKRCVQCGILKEEEEFRKYTYSRQKETKGRYRLCKSCEKINARYRFLQGRRTDLCLTTANLLELNKIDKLFDTLEERGLRTPRATVPVDADPIDDLLAFYAVDTAATTVSTIASAPLLDIPSELNEWLTEDPSQWALNDLSPEFLQETVYESLKAKYRPQLGIDKERMLPIYNDTYKSVLNDILRRFDDYEETYAIMAEAEETDTTE